MSKPDAIAVVEKVIASSWAGMPVWEMIRDGRLHGGSSTIMDQLLDQVTGEVETFGQMMERTKHVALLSGKIEQIRLQLNETV